MKSLRKLNSLLIMIRKIGGGMRFQKFLKFTFYCLNRIENQLKIITKIFPNGTRHYREKTLGFTIVKYKLHNTIHKGNKNCSTVTTFTFCSVTGSRLFLARKSAKVNVTNK